MKSYLAALFAVVVLISAAPAVYSGAAPENAGQILARMNKLPSEQRQKQLVEKAKAEGEVSFYSSLQAQQIEPFIRVFQKRYPFIKVNPYRVSGNRQVIKIQTELNAGNHLFDVTNGSSEQASAIKKIGAIDPYFSPQREFFNPPNRDKDGYFASLYVIPIVLGYNTNMVKRPDVPKSYEDLLQPKWKSNMFLDDEAYEWSAVLQKHMGRDKALQYMRALAKQDLRFMRGRTAQSQLLAAGERPIAIVLSGHTVLDMKARGAPVDQVILDPYFAQANKLMLARHAPHPHAAALLVDFMLSKKGQEIAYRQTRWPAHKDLATGATDEVGNRKTLVPDADKWGARFEELVQLTGLLER